MTPRALAPLLAALALALAGCSGSISNAPEEDATPQASRVLGQALARVRAIGQAGQQQEQPARRVPPGEIPATREQIEALGGTLLFGYLPNSQQGTAFALSAENADVTTWITRNGLALSFRRGVLTATRGFGFDLMSADVAETLALLEAGRPGTAVRVHRYLDGEDKIVSRSFVCDVIPEGRERIEIVDLFFDTRVLREDCVNPTLSFENRYWIDVADGTVRKSTQFISFRLGPVETQRLNP